MSELSPEQVQLYVEDYDLGSLNASYPRGTRRSFSNKYTSEIISELISEVDLKIPSSVIQALQNSAKQSSYKKYYDLLSLAKPSAERGPELAWLEEKLSFLNPHIFGRVFHKMEPGQIIKPHTDPIRQTSIYLPLFLNGESYSPLEIYHHNNIYGLGNHDNTSLYVWNARALHGVYNDGATECRYNFQLLVNLPYKETFELVKKHLGVRQRKDAYLTYDVKKFFSQFVDSWGEKSVLDWGCGSGNFLLFNEDASVNYSGCDINKELIDDLATRWPNNQFFHYDKYNRQYGHKNSRHSPLPLKGEKYDFIISFSVCTHIDLKEIKELINNLKNHLTNDGQILFSFFDNTRAQSWKDIVEYRYEYFSPADNDLWKSIELNKITYISIDRSGKKKVEHNLLESEAGDSQYFLSFFDAHELANAVDGELLTTNQFFQSKIMDGQKCISIKKHN